MFVFTGFCGFISLLLVFYSMLYLSICKDYQKISLFFLMGMAAAFGLAWLLVKVFHIQHASFTYDRIFSDGGDISGND